jgi:hypothetical protein
MKLRLPNTMLLVLLLLLNLFGMPVFAQDSEAKLRIVIVEGEGAINNIKQRVNREPIVQVEDENRKPVAGAAVVFSLPSQGPSGVFPNGTRTLTTNTDAQGRAAATGIRPNNQSGQLQIRVTASFQGEAASAVITQNNAVGSSSAAGGMSTGTKVLIIVAIAGAAAAGGIYAATRGGSSGSGTTVASGPGITITPGTPSVGGPTN